MSVLDHRLLRQLVAVADTGTVRAAARVLHMSQPPLTAAIRGLEDRLDVALFERSVRGMVPTPAGAVLVAEARAILARLERAEARTREAGGRERPLRVGFVSAALDGMLARLLAGLAAGGRPTPALMEMTTPEQVAALAEARLDLGLLHPPVDALPEGVALRPLGRDPFHVALPTGHRLAPAERLVLAEIAAEPLVLFPEAQGPRLYAAIREAVAETGATLHVAATARRVHTQLAIVAGGVGIGLVTASTARTLSVEGVVVRPLEGMAERWFLELAAAGEPAVLDRCAACLEAQ